MRWRTAFAVLVAALPLFAAEGLVQLVDPLDEPERYCLDVPGFRQRVRLDAPLMAHTCKPGADDELFTPHYPGPGQLYMKAYARCVAAEAAAIGASLYIRPCEGTVRQRFAFEANGRIKLAGSDLCVAVADGRGTPTGGPSHLRRDVGLESCADVGASLSRWIVPEAR